MIYQSRYGEIYYEMHGPPGKPLVVLCHGVGMDHKTFAAQVKALEGEYRVMIWDLPGHGQSTMENQDRGFSLMAAECLVGLMDEVQTQRAVLAGLSLGSFVIQHGLSQYPDRVKATVHIGGLPLYPKYSRLLKPLFQLTGMLTLMPSRMFYRSFAQHRANAPTTREYLEEAISRTGKGLVLKITRDMGEAMLAGVPAPPDRPLLITYGADDIFTRRLSMKWHKRAPGSQLAEISQANHIANQDNPEEFNRTLVSFLEGM